MEKRFAALTRHQLIDRHVEQLFLGVSEKRAKGRIGIDDLSFGIGDQKSLRQIRQDIFGLR